MQERLHLHHQGMYMCKGSRGRGGGILGMSLWVVVGDCVVVQHVKWSKSLSHERPPTFQNRDFCTSPLYPTLCKYQKLPLSQLPQDMPLCYSSLLLCGTCVTSKPIRSVLMVLININVVGYCAHNIIA